MGSIFDLGNDYRQTVGAIGNTVAQGTGALLNPLLGTNIGGTNPGSGGGGSGSGVDMSGMPQLSNTPAFQASQALALRQGPSPWAGLATQQQDAIKGQGLATGANQVAGQTAQADANLASSGGLSSGARERVAEGGAKNYMNMAQGLDQTAGNNKLQIGMNDEQNRMQQLNDFNSLNSTNYGNQLQAWASGNTANAISNSGKGGGK